MSIKAPFVPLRQRVQEYLIAHPEATNEEISKEFTTSIRTVSQARQNAIKNGLVGPSYFDRKSERGVEASNTGDYGTDGLETTIRKVLKESKPGAQQLTDEESLLALSEVARGALREGANKLAIEAHKAFHWLKSQSKDGKLGPAAPLTFDDKIERTSRILESVGLRVTKAAISVAFPRARFDLPPEPEPQKGLPYDFFSKGARDAQDDAQGQTEALYPGTDSEDER